jgi:hypothetical protein
MHDEIKAVCDSRDLQLSIFVDDIAVSGIGAESVINPIIDIIRKFGFSAPNKKQKIMRSGGPQILTGIGINQKVSKPRLYRENLAQRIFELGDEVELNSKEVNSLIGKIRHVKQASPHQEEHLWALFEKHINGKPLHLRQVSAISRKTRRCRDIRKHTYRTKK